MSIPTKARQRLYDVERFSFDDIRLMAKVNYCYDGDTLNIVCKPFNSYNTLLRDESGCLTEETHSCDKVMINVRMEGYNSAEINSKDEKELKIARDARDYLCSLVGDGTVYVEFGKNDKYGRPLVKLYKLDNDGKISVCINDQMLKHGCGKAYDGSGAKEW
jgi:endonuclease YncB( thermonuclease family)